ncbi:BnaC07g15010D [Brassica napus]|uniref:BnaC07g15010D protein n=1 Tax=Brassica napus TaxID=3708 RepID=A0A078DLI6_BRANA|nr:BnaC07g15010D [Brassica napus]
MAITSLQITTHFPSMNLLPTG